MRSNSRIESVPVTSRKVIDAAAIDVTTSVKSGSDGSVSMSRFAVD